MINSHASTELIRTFKKGAFNLRPPVTKYYKIWDPDVDYLPRLLRVYGHFKTNTIKYENCNSHYATVRTLG